MMILRNGVNSVLRARGRTVLFTLLILLLTLSLTLGAGMWVYCSQTLAELDANYTSIALVEYMGADYPNEDAADPFARDALSAIDDSAVSAVEGVELWERSQRSLVLVEGYERFYGEKPYGNMAVIVGAHFLPNYDFGYFPLDESDFPAAYAIKNILTGDITYHLSDGSVIESLHYFYNEATDEFFRYGADGTSLEITVPADLPERYTYSELSSGVYYVRGPSLPRECTGLEMLNFDPDTGIITGYRQMFSGATGIITKVLYTLRGKDNVAFQLQLGEHNFGFEPEKGQRYLLHGEFINGTSANPTLVLTPMEDGTLPYLPLETAEDPALENSLFAEKAALYATANNYVRYESSDDIAALEVFQQGTLLLTEGRFPTAGEAGVCVVSGGIAYQLGLSLGDSIAVTTLSSAEEDIFDLQISPDTKELQIVGITARSENYDGCVWVSRAEAIDAPFFGYALGRAVLDNDRAAAAVAELEALIPGQVRVTLFDQGYAAAAESVKTMATTATAVTITSACGAAAVLFLFAYLFVGRQRETVDVLVSLGTPRRKIRLWLLSGSMLLSGAAAAAGAAAGALAMKRIIALAMAAAKSLYTADHRYSESALGLVRSTEFSTDVSLWPAVLAGCAVFAVASLLCLFFLGQARRRTTPRRGRVTIRAPKGGTSLRFRGALRFAAMSMGRGGWRSSVVPACALVLSLFVSILASGAQGWSSQMDALMEGSQLQGQVTSSNGRQSTNLSVSPANARLLWNSGKLSTLSVSDGAPYWLPEEMPSFGSGGFAAETRAAWIAQQPKIIALNDLSAAAELYYVDDPGVTWLEGYDESVLQADFTSYFETITFSNRRGITMRGQSMPEFYPVIAGADFLAAHELKLGDSFSVCLRPDAAFLNDAEISVPLLVVGSFPQRSPLPNLYVPLSFAFDGSLLTGETDLVTNAARPPVEMRSAEDLHLAVLNAVRFDTCRFTLENGQALESFRQYLADNGLSQVGTLGANRTTILLLDQTFTETVGSLGRYISFSQALFPVLFVMVALMGFVISWLMVNSRRMEFAVMRGIGARRERVFASFFLEQALLCLSGCIVSCLLMQVFTIGNLHWLSTAGFAFCYLSGCALSILAVSRTKLISLLSERE